MRAGKLVTVDRDLAESHYAEHSEKPFFGELVDFITSAPTLALVLEGEGAIAVVRSTMGATNPADSAPGRSAATSRSRCRTTSSTAPTRRSRRARGRALVRTMSSSDALRNRAHWDRTSDEYQQRNAAFIGRPEPRWGMWQLPESELGVLGDVAGKDVLELGCGAAQWAILLAQRAHGWSGWTTRSGSSSTRAS